MFIDFLQMNQIYLKYAEVIPMLKYRALIFYMYMEITQYVFELTLNFVTVCDICGLHSGAGALGKEAKTVSETMFSFHEEISTL